MANQQFVKVALAGISLLLLGVALHRRRERQLIVRKYLEVGRAINLLKIHEVQQMLRVKPETN